MPAPASRAWACLRRSRPLFSRPPPYRGKKGGRGSRRSAACGEEREKGVRKRIEQREKKNRGEREIGFPKDLCVNLENCRDLSVKKNFPSI
jgi:hypothetical protein